jgi:acyl-ACP thioesterase
MKNSLKTGTLLEFFQETAALHAQKLHIGVADMMEHGVTWVLRRYRVNVYRRPGLGDVSVRTWYEPKRNLMSVRLFEATDQDGCVIADAWSGWIAIDLGRGKPVRLDRVLPAEYYENAGKVAQGEIDGVETPADSGVGDLYERAFRVRLHELDLNGHTNHTVYFDWATESVPDDVSLCLSQKRLDAEFLASAQREEVTVRSRRISDNPVSFAHSVTLNTSGAEAARLVTVWG